MYILTLAEAKKQLYVDHILDDDLIEGYIERAFYSIKNACNNTTWVDQSGVTKGSIEIPDIARYGTEIPLIIKQVMMALVSTWYSNRESVAFATPSYIHHNFNFLLEPYRNLEGFGTSSYTLSQGINGTNGTSGVNGINGTSGIDGSSGTSGIDGINGTSGTSGVDGTSGSSGTSGVDGTSGSSGTSGVDGTSGSSGTSGVDGTSGSSGTSGIDGTSGTSGIDGINGTSGIDGINGTSGTSGSSGTSGAGIDATIANKAIMFNSGGTLTGSTRLVYDPNEMLFAWGSGITSSKQVVTQGFRLEKGGDAPFTGGAGYGITFGNRTGTIGVNSLACSTEQEVGGTVWRSKATGENSLAWGRAVEATGNFATAFGDRTYASNEGSFVAGGGANYSSGIRSFSSGESNVASGDKSTATGLANTASGSHSFAANAGNVASGYGSFVTGRVNTAKGHFQTVVGFRNVATGSTTVTDIPTEIDSEYFIVGAGTGSTYAFNAFTVSTAYTKVFNDLVVSKSAVVGSHSTSGSTAQVVNTIYGTEATPPAGTYPEGTIYIQYTA